MVSLHLTDNTLHTPDTFSLGVSGILVVVDGKLNNEEIDISVGKNM